MRERSRSRRAVCTINNSLMLSRVTIRGLEITGNGEARALALKAAEKAVILLKNEGGLLPLELGIRGEPALALHCRAFPVVRACRHHGGIELADVVQCQRVVADQIPGHIENGTRLRRSGGHDCGRLTEASDRRKRRRRS